MTADGRDGGSCLAFNVSTVSVIQGALNAIASKYSVSITSFGLIEVQKKGA